MLESPKLPAGPYIDMDNIAAVLLRLLRAGVWKLRAVRFMAIVRRMLTMNQKIVNIIRDILRLSPDGIDPSIGMKTCGKWDSLAHINLMLAVEQEFGIMLSPDEMQTMTSYEGMAAVLSGKGLIDG